MCAWLERMVSSAATRRAPCRRIASRHDGWQIPRASGATQVGGLLFRTTVLNSVPMEAKTERSELTKTAIVDMALEMAALDGLESLSIGEIAKRLDLSKSGVFSRIGSREALQKAVLDEFDRRFQQDIIVPALREPRGLPRLDAMLRAWLERAAPASRGACPTRPAPSSLTTVTARCARC